MTDPAAHPRLAALLAAVLADPGEDAPRLVYADWLEEHGDADDALRGEFIRVQVGLAAREEGRSTRHVPPGGLWSPAIDDGTLRRRERALLCLKDGSGNRVAYRWASAMPLPFEEMTFRRGFVESVTCTADAWLAHAEAIRRAQPVREVRLTTDPRTVETGWLDVTSRADGYDRVFFNERWERVRFVLPGPRGNVIRGRNATAHVNRGTPDAPAWRQIAGPRPETTDP